MLTWPAEPKDVGDCYLLIGYPWEEGATLAFATHVDDPTRKDHFMWALLSDDGDFHPWGEEIFADQIILIRRVREGLEEYIPLKFRESALRYPPL